MYLGLDPGDTTGWAHVNDVGDPIDFGQIPESELNQWLNSFLTENDITRIICEDYRIVGYDNKKFRSHSGSRVPTIKKVGAIEAFAELHNVPVTLQANNCYGIGAKWGGFEIPTNHSISHQWVALAHVIYYGVRNQLFPPPAIRRIRDERLN